MSGLTSRVSLYKPASGENVNVVTDLNNNWDAVDLNLNFRTCTSGTRPSVQWDGLTIHETDTRKSYLWNSTPAVSGWYEIFTAETALTQVNLSGATTGAYTTTHNVTGDANKRIQVRADGRLEWGSGSGATDTFLSRTGAAALTLTGGLTLSGATAVQSTTESTALNVSGGGTFAKSLTVGGTASLGGGTGVVNLRNATTAPTAADSGGVNLYAESGQLKVYNPSGNIIRLNGSMGLSTSTTVANTVTETNLVNVSIPANDAAVGSTYRLKAWGHASVTGTPTLMFKGRLGSNQLASTTAFTASSGISLHNWNAEIDLVYLGSDTWMGSLIIMESVSVSGSPPTATSTLRTDGGGTAAGTASTALTFRLTSTWGTASSSNTLTCRGYTVERVS